MRCFPIRQGGMDTEAYRRLQGEAVTGHSGTSEIQVQILTSSIQVSPLSVSEYHNISNSSPYGFSMYFQVYGRSQFLVGKDLSLNSSP